MIQAGGRNRPGKVITFSVADALFGVDVLAVQEVNRMMEITPVPLAPDHVRGVINLRGKIVTVMDLAGRLGLPVNRAPDPRHVRNIIVHSQGELLGLRVDRVGDAFEMDWDEMAPPPGNVQGLSAGYFKGVLRQKENLVGVLDIEAVLR